MMPGGTERDANINTPNLLLAFQLDEMTELRRILCRKAQVLQVKEEKLLTDHFKLIRFFK